MFNTHACLFTYSMFDVGGQRVHRSKWIQCFNGTPLPKGVVLYCV